MNCPICESSDTTTGPLVPDLGHACECVACEALWLSQDGKTVDKNCPPSPGESRRAMRDQIERDDFSRAFNDPEGWGL